MLIPYTDLLLFLFGQVSQEALKLFDFLPHLLAIGVIGICGEVWDKANGARIFFFGGVHGEESWVCWFC